MTLYFEFMKTELIGVIKQERVDQIKPVINMINICWAWCTLITLYICRIEYGLLYMCGPSIPFRTRHPIRVENCYR